jgi:superfamily II DNA/RNA helicase
MMLQVINFDFPATMDEYLSRLGRVSRMGAQGSSISFVNRTSSKEVLQQLVVHLETTGASIPWELRRLLEG